MKTIVYRIILLLLISCNSTTDKKESNTVDSKVKNTSAKDVKPASPCELFTSENLASLFEIKDASTIEMYVRDAFRENTNQCQFIWPEEKGSIKASQIMVDITHKYKDMGATFSRMLELDIKNGLTAIENGKTITIKPMPIDDFGDHAYHWTQPSFQNVQKITFQVENNYRVDITYNSHAGVNIQESVIKQKLIEIGQQIKKQLN